MRSFLSLLVSAVLAVSLSGCETINWKRSANETLKNICREQDNCYATCPDGRRTDPNNPYCSGERPQDQPDRF